MKKILVKSILCLVFFGLFFFKYVPTSQSVPVTKLKNQLSSAQLSYFARLAAGNTTGDSTIIIDTGATAFSANNYNLDIGDTIFVGAGTTQTFTVKGLSDTNAISLSGAIGAGATTGVPAIVPRYATHYVSFAPQSYDSNEVWQVLIKANGATPADGIPDADGFDMAGFLATDVTCPWNGTEGVGTTTLNGSNYILITCSALSSHTFGDGTTGVVVIGGAHQLMNPAPALNHTVGQANASADTYTFYLRELNGTTLVTTNTGKIALTESVRVTVTVDPTITFSVGNSGVTSVGTTICGSPLGSGAPNTTGASVDFGSLNLSAFNNLAQFIQCTTNATNGYVVQAFESNRLTMIGGSTTIPDTTCPSNSCTPTSAAAWTTNSTSGFGYSLQVGTTSAGAVLGITTSGNYKPFGIGYANAQPIMSRTNTPASVDSAYIGYRVTVSTVQPAGTYQNEINFIATATF